MATLLSDDPYKTLGVPKDATVAAIKSAYRKLVLTCHPDKVSDETLKAQKAEEFHKIQKAYEKVGDEDARLNYDAECRLAELRKEKMEREARSGSYPTANTTAYRSARTAVFEERRPSFDTSVFDEPLRGASRKHEDYPSSRRSPPRATKTDHYSERERERVRRSERQRERDREQQRERDFKQSTHEYELPSEDRRRRDPEMEKPRSEPQKHSRVEGTGSLDYDMQAKIDRAREHMASVRPSSHRASSSQTFESPRRSRAPPKESSRARRSDSAERYKDHRPPVLETHQSSPAKMEIPIGRARSPPRRAYTMQPEFDYRGSDEMPHPGLRRAETAPSSGFPTSAPRRKDTNPAQPSRLRTSTTAPQHDSGYSSNSGPGSPEAAYGFHAEIPPAQPKGTSMRYHYPDDEKSSGKQTYEIRVPGRSPPRERERVRESASDRPPLIPHGSSRSGRYSFASAGETRRPSFVRQHASSATNPIPRVTRSPEGRRERERERDYHERNYDHDRSSTKFYYGEVPSSRSKDTPASYAPENIATRRAFRYEDVNYNKDYYGQKPNLERGHTFHYAKTPV